MLHARSMLNETGAAPVKPGFAWGKFLSSKSEHEKTDAEAVQDWESEGRRFYSFTRRGFCRSRDAIDLK
jgi:hypothetical protein